jgi:hypothetical protein
MHPSNTNWNCIYSLIMRCEDWEASYTEVFLVPKKTGFGSPIYFCFSLLKSHFHSPFKTKHQQRAYWHDTHTNTHQEDYFQVKFYIHDCYVQLQYVALGVMDHWNAFYHILGLEFGKYRISFCTESCPMVPYPFGQLVFYHCRTTYNTFVLET